MARWKATFGLNLSIIAGLMLSVSFVYAEAPEKIYQVAQNVPGLETLDTGKGTLGTEDEERAFMDSEEGKRRLERTEGVKGKKLLSTSGDLGDDAKTLVPYEKFFTAGYVGEEMDPVGSILGNRATRSLGGLISHDAMTFPDVLYIDIGQEDDVKVGDRFIVFSQYHEVRHPLKTFFITFEREIDLMDGEYRGEYYQDMFAFRHDIAGNQILVKGVIRVIQTSSITSRAIVEQAFNPIKVDDLIVPHPERRPPMIAASYIPPKKDIKGHILANRGDNLMFTMNDVVYLDQGEDEGVEIGDRFEIYAFPLTIDEDEDDINPEVIGEITVISIQEDTATGVILNASEPIIPGHKIRSKR
jgi:hypothetical protein